MMYMYVSIAFVLTSVLTTSYGEFSSAKKSSSNPNTLNTSQVSKGRQIYEYTHRVKWQCFNTSEEFDCCSIKWIICHESGPTLPFGYCATYSENDTTKSLSISKCPYLQWNNYNVTTPWFVSLPVSLTELNDYMCGPQNKKGLLCSECVDGFGPSVTSYGDKCANCTDAWYHIPLFLLVQFVPSTILYIIILTFRISVASPPMPCILICIQLFVLGFDMTIFTHSSSRYHHHEMIFTKDGLTRLDMKIIRVIYNFFNQMDVLRYVLPPTCLNSNLKQIHLYFFSYISVFYPILLIILTWVCVNLHDSNIRPFVWLWRPFHKCFVRLHRKWDVKSDLVDTFITFFLLSYIKSAYQAVVLLTYIPIKNIDQSGSEHLLFQSFVDPSIDYFGYTHIPLAVTAIFLSSIFNILPPLLLILYPIRAFRSCLSKCRLDFVAMNIFTDKIQCYYRNGLDGGKDMRFFSGLYLYLWISINAITIGIVKVVFHYLNVWFSIAVSFLIMAVILAVVKPYRKMYMNYMDALLILCIALQLFSMTSGMFRIARVLVSIPVVALFLLITVKLLKKCVFSVKTPLKKCCPFCVLKTHQSERDIINFEAASPEAAQPLIEPTTSEVSYNYDSLK